MKKQILLAAAALLGIGLSAMAAETADMREELLLTQGVGPAIAGSVTYSDLPTNAQDFLLKHFKDVKIRHIEKEYADGRYEVNFANGDEIDFDANGKVTEIEAKRGAIKDTVVKDILPQAAYNQLVGQNIHNQVKQIDVEKTVYEVKFVKKENVKLRQMKFDNQGKLLRKA